MGVLIRIFEFFARRFPSEKRIGQSASNGGKIAHIWVLPTLFVLALLLLWLALLSWALV